MTAPTLTIWLLATLAAYRLFRLVAFDDLPGLSDLRERLLDRYPNRYVEAIVCPWCAGWWACVATFAAVHVYVDAYGTVTLWLVHVAAGSTVVGLIGSRVDGR